MCSLYVSGAADVAFPQRLGPYLLMADGTQQLAGVRVSGVRVDDASGSALLAEESADVGHCDLDFGDVRPSVV